MAAATGNTLLNDFLDKRYVSTSDLLDKFNPERLKAKGAGNGAFGSDPAATGLFYVFITTPDLNLDSSTAKNILGLGTPVAPNILAKKLTGGVGFIHMLSNLVVGFPVQDVVMDVHQIGENWEGAKLVTPRSTLNSRQDGTIQLEFDEKDGLPVTLLHKIWIDYIDAVTKGTMSPKFGTTTGDYIASRTIDYACSIYCFHMMPDGVTIQFGMRYTGVFPTAVPFSAMSAQIGQADHVRVSIPYAYSYMEPMDAAIFSEFNASAAKSGVSIGTVHPYVSQPSRPAYYLKFEGYKSLSAIGGY